MWFPDLVTSVHDHWYCARCVNTTNPAGEGAIVVQTAALILVTMYGIFSDSIEFDFFFEG